MTLVTPQNHNPITSNGTQPQKYLLAATEKTADTYLKTHTKPQFLSHISNCSRSVKQQVTAPTILNLNKK